MNIMMNDTEKLRVECLRKGSVDDFNFLYSVYAPSLYSFALRLLKSRSEAQDIVQDTFLNVWTRREDLSTDYSFKSYLYTIAKNKILTRFQKRVREITIEEYREHLEENSLSDTDIEQSLISQDIKCNLYAAISKLSPLQAKIFIMKTEDDLSTHDISAKLNIPHQTVKNNFSIAMKRMREELKNLGGYMVYLLLLRNML